MNMTKAFIRLIHAILCFFCLYLPIQAQATLVDDLKDGQHILLMRHADAPGYGDPAGYVIGQCSTQRNLGEYGKKQAKAIGAWLAKQGVEAAQVLSSPWCRCSGTAQLLNLGPIKIEPSLGSFFDEMSLEKKQTKELQQLIKGELDKQAIATVSSSTQPGTS